MNNLEENAKGKENIGTVQAKGILERALENAVWKIGRWASKADKKVGRIYSKKEALRLFGVPQFTEIKGNCLCNEGIEEWFKLIATTGAVQYNNAGAYLIVGTGSGAADPTDNQATFTSGVTKVMEATYPQVAAAADHKCTWKSSYGSAEANQVWAEFGLLNHATTGKLANRKVSAQGTKAAGQTWELTLEITLT